VEKVKGALLEVHELNTIHTVVMDVTRAEDVAAWIESELGAAVIERGQSNAYAVVDYTKWMEALRQRWLWHSNDPELNRHVLNAIARQLPGGDVRFDRASTVRQGGDQESRVIDGLQAASMVHTVASAVPPKKRSWKAF
jgi:hypothetical protein